jgi:MFS transporter, DHA2 family, multidrug resistance protein
MGNGTIPVPNRVGITVSVMLAAILQSLDTTIANVALPHIRGSVSASVEQMGWVLTSYIVAAAIMTPLSGWLAGRFGRKKVLIASIVGFTLSSALCGIAQTVEQIVLFRLMQGASGAGLLPLSQAVLLDINPPERQGRASAIWAMGILIGPILGPVLGGWLTENYSWRWAFYVNVPFGTLALLGVLSFLREGSVRRSPLDFLGFATLSLAVGALQIMLDRGELLDWFGSTEIWFEAAVALLAFYLFLVHTLTARHTFVNLALFADANFSAGALLMFVACMVMLSNLALLPTMAQDLLGYPVGYTGLVMAPRGVGAFLTTIVVARIIGRIDARLIVGSGLGFMALSLWQMSHFSPQMDERLLVISGLVQGVGTGLALIPLTAVSFVTLKPAYRYEGTAIFNLLRNVGGSIGIAMTESFLARNTQTFHERLGEHVSIYDARVRALIGASPHHGFALLNTLVTKQAAFLAYTNNFRLLFFATLAVMPLVMVLSGPRNDSPGGHDSAAA